MLQILIGGLSGIFSGIGMGGGTILIFLLTTFAGLEQHIAQATNIVFFIPTSIIAIIVNLKQKLVDVKTGTILIITGIVGAIIGAILAKNIDAQSLKKYFGIFLGIIALFETYTIIKQYILKRKKT